VFLLFEAPRFKPIAGDFLPAPELLAGLLTITIAGILVEATFRLLERGTLIRWGMKVGRE
jgi:ABC-type nitrate/sulfonate/bicarbonate transport system permease component